MMRRTVAIIAFMAGACALAAIPAGCASPSSHFYTLNAGAAPAATAEAATSGLVVIVGPVSVPAVVDMPQIVVRTGPNQVSVDEFNRWASPLQSNISHVVADNLVAMLGTPRVMLYQQAQNTEGDYRVSIDVQTFESAPGDAATLSALWVVRRVKDGKTQIGRTDIREATPEKSYQALAAGHSRALGRLSGDIATAIRMLDRGP
ncbi:MAG: membrane integrity-associated transporter subunit PqiC [Steroidobacteraceae bacterium]